MDDELTLPPNLKALARLERDFLPTRGRLKLPMLRRLKPVPPAMAESEIHIPTWEWERPTPAGADLITLDVNAAWPAACSSARYAHGPLKRTGPLPFLPLPGMWKCDLRGIRWRHSGSLVSPLGSNSHRDKPWLTTPTVALLMELVEAGYWDEFPILDSWTTPETCRLTEWAKWIRETRDDLRRDEPELLPLFKESYATAVVMWLKGDGCDLKRPDWYYTTLAQTAASHWRCMWRAVLAGHGPVRTGSVDEMAYTADDLTELMDLEDHRRPFRIDPTGAAYGTYKIKKWL